MPDTNQTIVLISGANTGIGLAVAKKLAKDHGYHVVVGSRNAAAGEEVAAGLVASGFAASSVQLDVTSDASIAAAVSWIEHQFGRLDVLINNAGILIDFCIGVVEENKGLSSRELYHKTFNTNIFGAGCLTEACEPLLRESNLPRVIFVSTRMASLAVSTDKTTPWYPIDYKVYDASKAALGMLAINYARILDDAGGMVNVVCPGLVKTNLTRFHPMGTDTDVGSERIVELAISKKGGPTATFSDRNGSVPW
jgi:NAD(P)-dependent dehydrogenase (short-subunit alcohol dehydrogenase family)